MMTAAHAGDAQAQGLVREQFGIMTPPTGNSAGPGSGDAGAVVFREPSTARGTWVLGSLFEHLLESPADSTRVGVAVVTQPAGTATPLHRHTREAEAFYLLNGVMEYVAGDQHYELYPGCFIYLPAGVPHAFRIRGAKPARFLALAQPGPIFHLYDEVGIPARELRLPGPDGQSAHVEIGRWVDLAASYGLELVGPPIPE